jgi:succinate-acetate transporter protein
MADDHQTTRPEEIARVVVRPYGSVLPLGFLAFGVGAFVTASFSLGWIKPTQATQMFVLLLVFVVPLQAIAGVFAFLSRDTAGGTTLTFFAGVWASFAAIGLTMKPGETSEAEGFFLLAVGVVIIVFALASIVGNPALTAFLLVGCARFVFNGVYQLTGSKTMEHVAGYAGLALVTVAGYAGLAFLLEDGAHRPVLPFVRRGAARAALDADLIDQLRRLEREPGVRARL